MKERYGSNEKQEKAIRDAKSQRWHITIGLEIHAQLNTARKLFSNAKASADDEPNTNVALFDMAFPGTMPIFQKATLIPAIRAALAFNCAIQHESTFDRKHYFYHDQPAGYQITQYYSPYAKNGGLTLTDLDGMESPITIRIKQIQMEQDTAKSTMQGTLALLDFNRVGQALIEIITEPDMHSAKEAAACAKKIQVILQSVNAVTTGMEHGGLRADVNVSVSPAGSSKLGQRVEIKNLSTFQSIEAAIHAEEARQIAVLKSGGEVAGETRSWSLGSTETRRLRGKEGEVDYRYMPDPDIQPLTIGQDLIDNISAEMPPLPDDIVHDLVENSGLTVKDAKTLMTLENGARLDYFDEVKALLAQLRGNGVQKAEQIDSKDSIHPPATTEETKTTDRTIANWTLQEIGHLLSTHPPKRFSPSLVPPLSLASILYAVHIYLISRSAAKRILKQIYNGDERSVEVMIREATVHTLSESEYGSVAEAVLSENAQTVESITTKGKTGKVQFLVGQMIRQGGKELVQPQRAEAVLREKLGLSPKA
ncbi:uncharacterized protein KY384_005691 [Bacidia gigantensis]|uniref:uncharacterized protein n=1 Tax=Bacidia gigantensis TaxID=2732470 RepID=UPI001D03D8DA|nr:uncharacterized protein KY384_005691 [Bacidia gigantensis]KAG8529056.1 hypothetical protein KY384_005691 [Bacidia gigantensis]